MFILQNDIRPTSKCMMNLFKKSNNSASTEKQTKLLVNIELITVWFTQENLSIKMKQ